MNSVIEILKETGALLEGHFLLSSGRHSDKYCQCAKLLQYPDKAEKVLRVVADRIKGLDFDVVVGPAMGGIIVAYEIARQVGKPSMFTERENGIMTLRRGFEIKKGQKVLITEDVITTGKSSMEAIEVIKQFGGNVIGIASIVDRSGGKDVGYPIYSAVKLDIESWESKDCPLCKVNVPFVKPGSRSI